MDKKSLNTNKFTLPVSNPNATAASPSSLAMTPSSIVEESNEITIQQELNKKYNHILIDIRTKLYAMQADAKGIPELIKHIDTDLLKDASNKQLLEFVVSHIHKIRNDVHLALGELGDEIVNKLDSILNQVPITKKIPSYEVTNEELKQELTRFSEQKACSADNNFKDLLQKMSKLAFSLKFKAKTIFISHAWPLPNNPFADAWTEDFLKILVEHLRWAGITVWYDKQDSGGGTPLFKFMNGGIDVADNVIVICTRTMKYKFDHHGFTGACYEYLRYMDNYIKILKQEKSKPVNAGKKYVIPLCLSKEGNQPGLVAAIAELSIYNEGYLPAFINLIRFIGGFGDQFWDELSKQLNVVQQSYLTSASLSFVEEKHVTQSSMANIYHQLAAVPASQNTIYPLVCNVGKPVKYFSGAARADVLTELNVFKQTKADTYVIYGSGGIGKSQLAKYYAKNNINSYSIIWWFNGNNILEDYKQLTIKINEIFAEKKLGSQLNPNEKNPKVLIANITAALNKFSSWLLIFDDVDTEQHTFLPNNISDKGQILITTRSSDWPGKSSKPLRCFTKEEAANFITKHLDRPMEQKAAEDVAVKVAGLPLALAQIVGYLTDNPLTIQNFLLSFAKIIEGDELLSKNHSNYSERTINAIWTITKARIIETEPQKHSLAFKVLFYCAYLSPNEIPIILFENFSQNEFQRTSAIKILVKYSLVILNNEKKYISIHPIMQLILQNEMALSTDNKLVYYVEYFNQVFPVKHEPDENESSKDNSPLQAELKPHLQQLYEHAKSNFFSKSITMVDSKDVDLNTSPIKKSELSFMRLVRNLGIAHYTTGHLHEAILYLREAALQYAEQEKLLRSAHGITNKSVLKQFEEIALCYSYLGLAFQYNNEHKDALVYISKLRDLRIEIYNGNHYLIANNWVTIGYIYMGLKDYDQSFTSLNEALAVCTKYYSTQNKDEYNRGFDYIYLALGNYYLTCFEVKRPPMDAAHQAIANFEKAQCVRERIYPAGHGYLATMPNNIGVAYLLLGDAKQALLYLQKSMEVLIISSANKDTPARANTSNHMSRAYYMLEQYDKALQHAEYSLNIYLSTYGPKHDLTAKSYYYKGRALLKLVEDSTNGKQCLDLARKIFLDNKSNANLLEEINAHDDTIKCISYFFTSHQQIAPTTATQTSIARLIFQYL